jgi:ribosomal protein S6E (S10)
VSPSDGPTRPVFTTITIDAGSMDGFIMRTGLIAPLQHRILVKGGASVAGASA